MSAVFRCNTSARTASTLKTFYAKIDKLCKGEERSSFKVFQNALSESWYLLALDEAVCSTVYSLGYDTDPKIQVIHLKQARRTFNVAIANMGGETKERGKKDLLKIDIMKRGKEVVKEAEPNYDSETDMAASAASELETPFRLNTKPVRGEGVKKKIKDAAASKASEMLGGKETVKKEKAPPSSSSAKKKDKRHPSPPNLHRDEGNMHGVDKLRQICGMFETTSQDGDDAEAKTE